MSDTPEIIPQGITLARLAGIEIREVRRMREEDAVYLRGARIIVCGSLAAFKYRLTVAEVRRAIRKDLEEQLDAFAARVGVDRMTTSK